MSRLLWCAVVIAMTVWSSSVWSSSIAAAEESDPFKRAALLREAGRAIFSDASLSLSGKQSCASCHAPDRRYNPPDARDIEPGGKGMDAFSFRTPPTSR